MQTHVKFGIWLCRVGVRLSTLSTPSVDLFQAGVELY